MKAVVKRDFVKEFYCPACYSLNTRVLVTNDGAKGICHVSVQAPVIATTPEGLETGAKELLSIVKRATDPYVRKLEELKEKNRGGL